MPCNKNKPDLFWFPENICLSGIFYITGKNNSDSKKLFMEFEKRYLYGKQQRSGRKIIFDRTAQQRRNGVSEKKSGFSS